MKTELERIQNLIYEIRGYKVMLDSDLAELYGVDARSLNQAVKRNITRFPADFMFQLTEDEWILLRSQTVISKDNRGGRRYIPFVFTELGVAMLSSVLKSNKAIEVNMNIMRAFVKLRYYALSKPDTNNQIAELRKFLMLYIEKTDNKFSEHDETIRQIVHALNNLIEKPKELKKIGFRSDNR